MIVFSTRRATSRKISAECSSSRGLPLPAGRPNVIPVNFLSSLNTLALKMLNWNTTSEHCVRFVSIEKFFKKLKFSKWTLLK